MPKTATRNQKRYLTASLVISLFACGSAEVEDEAELLQHSTIMAGGESGKPINSMHQQLVTSDKGVMDDPSTLMVPCGYSVLSNTPDGDHRIIEYYVRNCHPVDVYRKIDVVNGDDGACHKIPSGATHYNKARLKRNQDIRGIKPC